MGIKYVSEVMPSGYGNAGRGYLRAFCQAGVDVTWAPMVVGQLWRMYMQPHRGATIADEFGGLYNRKVQYNAVLVHLIAPYYRKWREAEPSKMIVGVTVWETDRLPPGGIEEIRVADALIVPCRWNAEVYRKEGFDGPIHVAPHVHLPPPTEVAPLDLPRVRPHDFVFYTIGEWKDRKGIHLTVEAFCRAFRRDDPAVLVIKTGPLNEMLRSGSRWWWHVARHFETTRRALDRILARHKRPPRVVLLAGSTPREEIEALHGRGDCYVSLTRTEGWGLGAYEAAFAGKPVIMTGHGGQLDYLLPDLSFHVDFQLVEAQPRGQIDQCYAGQRWAEPDVDHGARLMRYVLENSDAARERGSRLRDFVRATFDARKIARGIADFAENPD